MFGDIHDAYSLLPLRDAVDFAIPYYSPPSLPAIMVPVETASGPAIRIYLTATTFRSRHPSPQTKTPPPAPRSAVRAT